MGDEDLEGGLDDLVGDLDGDFGDGEVREAENEFRDERISGLFFSLFSFFFFLLSKAVESGRFPGVNHGWEGLGEYQLRTFATFSNFNFAT